MNEIDDFLGFTSEQEEVLNYEDLFKFTNLWRLVIHSINCKFPPEVNKHDGVILPNAFDLKEKPGGEKEKSLSFNKLSVDSGNINLDETHHMEIMATKFNKKKPDALRENRCSILLTKDSLIRAISSDPQNKIIATQFYLEKTKQPIDKSKFSEITSEHWDGFYKTTNEDDIYIIKSTLAKCSKIINR